MALIVLILFGLILASGIRIVIAATKDVNPGHLQRISGTRNVKVARIGGWAAILLAAAVLIIFFWSIATR
jgi:hypothetical protein